MLRACHWSRFEGVEGSGKSTQLALAAERLRAAGAAVSTTREPGGTPIGERIRAVLMDAAHAKLEPMAEWLLIEAARRQHVEEILRPALADGAFVLCDRFSDSTEAYQVAGRGLDAVLVRELDRRVRDGIAPDLTLLYDLDPREGLARARRRDARDRPFRVGGSRVPRAGARRVSRDRTPRAGARRRRRRRGRRLRRLRSDLAPSRREARSRMTAASSERRSRLANEPERFPGALLLTGSSEVALERESRLLAARAGCALATIPDARCGSCRRVASGLHPDFFSVEPEGVQIRVDRVREALAFAVGRPYESAAPRGADLAGRAARARGGQRAAQGARGAGSAPALDPDDDPAGSPARHDPLALRPASPCRLRVSPSASSPGSSAGSPRRMRADLILFAADDDADPSARLEEGRGTSPAAGERARGGPRGRAASRRWSSRRRSSPRVMPRRASCSRSCSPTRPSRRPARRLPRP